MTELHQILAITTSAGADAEARRKRLAKSMTATGPQSPLAGIDKTYRPRFEDGAELPPEFEHVQVSVERDVLPELRDLYSRVFDLQYTREEGNTRAKADVVVDGTTLLADVPAGYLLFLETQLTAIREFILQLPVHDPGEEWKLDLDNPGVYVTAPKERARPRRVPKAQVLYEATPEHPAQVRAYEVEEPEGYWTTVKTSGALTQRRKRQLADRALVLLHAVKMAREKANTVTVVDPNAVNAAETVFDYLLAP